jgi:hypothetical protein
MAGRWGCQHAKLNFMNFVAGAADLRGSTVSMSHRRRIRSRINEHVVMEKKIVRCLSQGSDRRRTRIPLDRTCQIGYRLQPLEQSNARRVRVNGASFSQTPHHAVGAPDGRLHPMRSYIPSAPRALTENRAGATLRASTAGASLTEVELTVRFRVPPSAGRKMEREPSLSRQASAGRTSAVENSSQAQSPHSPAGDEACPRHA